MSATSESDAIAAGIEDDIRRVQARAERMVELAAATEGIHGSAASQGRDLVVEADASGRVTKLQIANQALSRGGARLATELMALFGQAHQHAQAQNTSRCYSAPGCGRSPTGNTAHRKPARSER